MKRLSVVAIWLLLSSVHLWADRKTDQQILQGLCNKEYFLTEKAMGCTKCLAAGPKEKLTVEKSYQGSFSKKGTEELILDLAGPCFANNPGNGAMALLRGDKGRWKLADWKPKRSASNCEKIVSPKQPDVLACEPIYVNGGVQHLEETIVRVKDGELASESLITVIHDDDGACGELVHRTERRSRLLGDANKDGEPDLHVGFEFMLGTRGFFERKKDCETPQNWKKQIYSLIWFRNGESFQLSPQSEPVLKEIQEFRN